MSRALAGRAALWSAIDIAGRQVVTLIVSAFLARLLTPADFGAVAISTFFATVTIAVIQQSLSTAVVQRHEATHEEVSSIFWWNIIASIAIAACLIAIRIPVARYFALPVLAPLIVASAMQILLSGLGTVHVALLGRELRFRTIAKAGIPATIVSGLLGVFLAYRGAGVWSLATQLVSSAAISSIAYWWLSGWRPALVLRASGVAEAVRFARWVGISAGLEALYTQGFALILGKLYGARDIGLYGRAASTQQVPANATTSIIARVALPLFSVRRDDPQALKRGLLAANRAAMVIMMPAMVGLTLTADVTIRVLFGPQWDSAAPVLAILAWAGMLYPISANNLQLLLASGRSDIFFRVELAKKTVGVIAVIIGSYFGILGLAWSQLIFSIIAVFINTLPSARYFGCGAVIQFGDLLGTAAATAIMAVSVIAFRAAVHLPPLACLCGATIVGSATYVLSNMLLRNPAFKEAWSLLSEINKGTREGKTEVS